MAGQDQNTVFRELRTCQLGLNNQSTTVQAEDGTRLTNIKDCLCRWKDHFNDLLNKSCDATDAELQRDADQATPDADSHTDPVTSLEVELRLKCLKNRRAPGICSITAELLKKGGDSMINWLVYIINSVWIKKTIPDDWQRGIILLFWKNKENKEVCSNHRGITLLSIPGKLFAMILLERIRPTFHNHRRLEQTGFTAGQSKTNKFSQVVKSTKNRRNLISLPKLLLSTLKLPLTQWNFLFLCVNCTQTPAVRCASLLLCQKNSPSRLA